MKPKPKVHTDALFARLIADVGMRLVADAGLTPKWNTLFPTGKWHHHSGTKLDLTRELAKEFIANWKAGGSPRLPITMHHAPGDEAKMSRADLEEAKKARGWIEDLRIGDGESLIEAAIKWTDATKKLIDADEYSYISPEWSMAHRDRRTGEVGGAWIWGAALTNEPFFDSMPRVAASHETQPTQPPDEAVKAKEQHMLKRLIAALRLPETATEDEVVAAAEKILASHTEAEVKLTAAVKQTAETAVLKATVDSLKASNDELSKKFAAAEEEKKSTQLTALIDGARRAGKAMPADLVANITAYAKLDFEGATKMVASLPVNPALKAEMGVSTAGAGDETPESAHLKLTAAVDELAKKEGISHDAARQRVTKSHPQLASLIASDAKNLTTRKESR